MTLGIGTPVAIRGYAKDTPLQYGRFYGLLSNYTGCDRCGDDGFSAVVSIDGHGLVLELAHPSRVTPIPQIAPKRWWQQLFS